MLQMVQCIFRIIAVTDILLQIIKTTLTRFTQSLYYLHITHITRLFMPLFTIMSVFLVL